MNLLEMAAALALLGVIAAGTVDGLSGLLAATRLEAGRMDLVLALSEARRESYLGEETIFAAAAAEDSALTLRRNDGSERRIELRGGVAITRVPARGGVHFAQSGWAENGTFAVGWPGESSTESAVIIVNQRGRIR